MATVATLSTNEQWVPQSEQETQVKAAMQTALVTSPNSVITKSPDNQTNRFILQTQGYFDIYQYVVMGMTFTSSKDEFEREYIKSTFQKVDQIDTGAYALLRDTTIRISQECKEFNENGLGRLTTSANGAIAFADQCIGLMRDNTDISLSNSFRTLYDEKYRTGPKDDAFEEAKETAKMVLTNLARVSKANGQDAAAMVVLLHAFHGKVNANVQHVNRIHENFLTGPIDRATGKRKVKPDGQFQEPYCNVMDAEITRLQEEVTAQTKIKDDEHDRWNTAKDQGIKDLLINGLLGMPQIGATVEGRKAFKALDAYNDAIGQITKGNEEKASIVKVLGLVRALVNNYDQLLEKMKQAMAAMEQVAALFTEQNKNFLIIDNKFEDLLSGVNARAWALRKHWILRAIEEAVEKFKEIKALGEEFSRSAHPRIVTI